MRYVSKPVIIEAIQYDPSDHRNCEAVEDFLGWDRGQGCREDDHETGELEWAITNSNDTVFVSPGEWIIKDLQGEFFSCNPEIFESMYDKVDD